MMTFGELKKYLAKNRELDKWMMDRGARLADIMEIPQYAYTEVIEGRALLFVYKHARKCKKCGRRHVQVGLAKATKKPLEKLFRKTKNKKSNT